MHYGYHVILCLYTLRKEDETMLITAMVNECDFDNIKFDEPVAGAHLVVQGATGRWCTVMYVGPEALARSIESGGAKPITWEQAVEQIEKEGGWLDL